jgi:hypothetical protein
MVMSFNDRIRVMCKATTDRDTITKAIRSTRTGGGTRLYDDSLFGIAQAFTWIAEELGRQYSIGYYPATAGKEGERRQIKVKTTESDLVVKARDSYIYSNQGSKFTQVTRFNP